MLIQMLLNEKGVLMKPIYILIVINMLIFSVAWAKPFPGHVQYDVKYSKLYKSGPLPKEYQVDLYVTANKKAIVTKASYKPNVSKLMTYIFDDEKKVVFGLDSTSKRYTEISYDKLTPLEVTDHKPLKPAAPQDILGEKVSPVYFQNIATKLTYSVWYSSYVTTPFLKNSLDIERMVEPKTGRLALVLTREVAKDVNAVYVAKKIDNVIPKDIFEVPKSFKKVN